MELFNAIPASVFTLLTSKNREIYAKALLITRESFSNEITLEKESLISNIATNLKDELLDYDPNVDEGFSQEDLKDISSKARSIVQRFKDTGWLESEYAKGSKLQELVCLPPYSIQLLNLIYDLCSEEIKEYDAFMYAMYSSLKSAEEEYKDYRYTSLVAVYDKVIEFENTLKGLFTDLKRHYTRMSHLKTVNQLLNEHFDSYQKDIIKQIYLPLKTRDSISRFKGPIIDILTKWLRDKEALEDIISQASIHKHFASRDLASSDVIGKINFITDKLISLQELLKTIDERNNQYVQTATDKLHVLLRKDKSIKAKLIKITQQLANERRENIDKSYQIVADELGTFEAQEVMNEESLFIRTNTNKDTGPGVEIIVHEFDDQIAKSALDRLDAEMNSEFSNEGIEKFMREQMDELDTLSTKDMNIDSMNTMILVMYAFVKGFNDKSFYRMTLNEGNVVNHTYSVPDVDFNRKR